MPSKPIAAAATAEEEKESSATRLNLMPELIASQVASFRKKNIKSKCLPLHSRPSNSLKLYRRPNYYFSNFSDFLDFAIRENRQSLTSVEMSWIFFAALTELQRYLLLTEIGKLPNLVKLQMEGTTVKALIAALQAKGCGKLAYLHIGSLRISNEMDINTLAMQLKQQTSLQKVFLANVCVQIEGRHRLDDEGGVRFEEIRQQDGYYLTIDPLLKALADLPTLDKIDLQLELDASKVARIRDETLQALCRQKTKQLILQACNLDDQHCVAISRIEMEELELLSLAANEGISSEGWAIIAKMLETNYFMKYLETQYEGENETGPSQICRHKMDYYLKLNRAGRGNLSKVIDSHIGWVELLIREKDDVDISHYALLTNPCLCMNSSK
mmetsp:Transcript_28788/g.43490  ORF Transcript_28788/g.43490 Transcript_28788/m.43490 type:complete len:385 (-) Transcript_28788:181-1335(-)